MIQVSADTVADGDAVVNVKQTWNDLMLTWDPHEFGGVEEIRIPVSKIWKPDIVLYN